MAVPGFQTWFLPLLSSVRDGKVHKISELYVRLADEMSLSDEDRGQLLASGGQAVYVNRIGWARTYLKKAGLLDSPGKGLITITERGLSVLSKKPTLLTVRFLKQFPEFVEFHTYRGDGGDQGGADVPVAEETPRDTLERVHRELNEQLATDVIEKVKKMPPPFFERLVVDLLLRMGYGGSREDAGRTLGKSGDGGVDGVINEDRLGLDVVYIQAKRWEGTVGRPVVQAFAGSLEGVRARKGVLITTSAFSGDADSYVRAIEKRIVLIDGPTLARLMIQHNVGVASEATYELKRLDTDYFED
jgi:restriction system protein